MNRFSNIDCSYQRLTAVYGFCVTKLVLIDEALQSVQSQINKLPYFIKRAKKHYDYSTEHVSLFDTALNKLSTIREVVWRGVPADIGKNVHENDRITWWSLNSCSSKVNVIKGFLENKKNSTMFLIEAFNGKKSGTQFRVKCNTLDHPNGSYVLHLIEVDEKNDDNNHKALALSMNQINSDFELIKSSS
ncbi:unnamed protein product [Adineta steineri]|uniref:NAD(+)--protein-arginine ADP-ribosyltransferase n=1 Tax=Adineta steineri TaxID=433720 RepID=A0A818NU39_9BILA|nr:unnamed protein product [Adineta steineri]